MNIAIITARGGSKRIPRKNIKDFLGKPIIAYSIEAALASNLFDEVMVSTDDDEIAQIACSFGAKVPFLRSGKSSDDFATTAEVLQEVLASYKAIDKEYTYACCIYPTAPFVDAPSLTKAFTLLTEKALDSVFPIQRFSFPIQRALVRSVLRIWKQGITILGSFTFLMFLHFLFQDLC
jgi:pseudaminic acid cytidylyltransferase